MRTWGFDEWMLAGLMTFLGLMVVGLLTGLGFLIFHESTEIQSGTIVDKAYYPEVTELVPMYTSCGNNCSVMTVVPVTTPECYTLYLREGDETGDVCVDVRQYNQVKEGDFYGAPKG